MTHSNPLTSIHSFFGRLAAVFILAFMFAGTSSAVVLLIDPATGKLTGATGVVVGVDVYNVAFRDGTCISLFNGCNGIEDFVFASQVAANVASNALMGAVFYNNDYDTNPQDTTGCGPANSACTVFTPFGSNGTDANISFFANYQTEVADYVSSGPLSTQYDTSSSSNVFAVWIKASTVPEPSSWALLGLAGVALGWSQRRRRLPANERVQ